MSLKVVTGGEREKGEREEGEGRREKGEFAASRFDRGTMKGVAFVKQARSSPAVRVIFKKRLPDHIVSSTHV